MAVYPITRDSLFKIHNAGMVMESLLIMLLDFINGLLRFVLKIELIFPYSLKALSLWHFNFLQGKEREPWLQQLSFGVFGLGNRQYEHFNKVHWLIVIHLAKKTAFLSLGLVSHTLF